jgi:hypothetical protein
MRMLGIGVLVALVASAIGAGSASASRDKYTVNTWAQYKNCPYENEEVEFCVYGRTTGGKEGGEFQYGTVRVLLKHPVVIQLGFKGAGENTTSFPASNGETLEDPEPEPIVKGLKVLTSQIQEEAEWPEALKQSFTEAKKNKETKAFAKIEFAGNECFEIQGCINVNNLLFEEGPAFQLALKVTVTSPWLEKLGGGPCIIGSDEHPIHQNLTDEGVGHFGSLEFNEAFTQLEVKNSELVDIYWEIEEEAGPKGCGGPEYESYVDNAIRYALELGYEHQGLTWLMGDLHEGATRAISEGVEKGELP